MDAACGESRQGRRVSPCPSKITLFREAEGHPASRKPLLRLPRGTGYGQWPHRSKVYARDNLLDSEELAGVVVEGGGQVCDRSLAQFGHGL